MQKLYPSHNIEKVKNQESSSQYRPEYKFKYLQKLQGNKKINRQIYREKR